MTGRAKGVACGNNEVDRSMIVSMGGLAVKAAVADAVDPRQALAQLLGREAVRSESKEYFVLRDGSRVVRTTTDSDEDQHVHVVKEHRGQPNTAMVQITDRSRTSESFLEGGQRVHENDRDGTTIRFSKEGTSRGHFERIEVWTPNRPLRDEDLRAEERALVEKMNSRIRQGRRK